MSEILNLNKARKARTQAEKKSQADENAVRFGLCKVQKEAAQKQSTRAAKAHDANKRER